MLSRCPIFDPARVSKLCVIKFVPRRRHLDIGSINEARLVRSTEHRCPRDFIGPTKASERNLRSHLRKNLFSRRFVGTPRCVDRPWAEHIDPDLSVLEVQNPSASEAADGRFRCRVETVLIKAFTGRL